MKLITRKQAKENGETRYYTGKPCVHGHTALRQVASGRCTECDKVLQSTKEYKDRVRAHQQKPETKARNSEYNKTPKRKALLSRMQKESYHRNKPAFLMRLLVSRFPKMVRDNLDGCSSTEKLGFTLDEFKNHFESLFLDGMNWDNHGQWHIDHIIPVSKFPIDRIMELNSLSNLQPLWALDNLKKGDRLIW